MGKPPGPADLLCAISKTTLCNSSQEKGSVNLLAMVVVVVMVVLVVVVSWCVGHFDDAGGILDASFLPHGFKTMLIAILDS